MTFALPRTAAAVLWLCVSLAACAAPATDRGPVADGVGPATSQDTSDAREDGVGPGDAGHGATPGPPDVDVGEDVVTIELDDDTADVCEHRGTGAPYCLGDHPDRHFDVDTALVHVGSRGLAVQVRLHRAPPTLAATDDVQTAHARGELTEAAYGTRELWLRFYVDQAATATALWTGGPMYYGDHPIPLISAGSSARPACDDAVEVRDGVWHSVQLPWACLPGTLVNAITGTVDGTTVEMRIDVGGIVLPPGDAGSEYVVDLVDRHQLTS